MNTFLPYASYAKSAACLDDIRLNKQISECAQMLRQLDIWPRGGWAWHPAVKMWVGYDDCLFNYFAACWDEWISRGGSHDEWYNIADQFPEFEVTEETPPWWGGPIHDSHKNVLAYKWAELPHEHLYYWPV